ncbi:MULTISPECIES: hypothetical protein [Stenotrophomonas]|uniref:hypothetical protein n=1 Tax=Stenotrophomonas TaxID=40323 RepID=UPI001CF3A2FF|nr:MULTISPECIES: hypothetical protein [Stenotrophomonas]MCA7024384.1 hypothetical protein [Stenotrophomonas acidaminiphila]MCE4076255.1 hypothetical protein [Stenotrophomonas acidaminiphila]
MKRSYKYLMLALVIGNAQAAQRELFNARETLERAKVGTYSPRAQPPVRVEVEESARFRANGHGNRRIQQQFERMDCKLDESTNSMRCVPFPAEEVNRPKK